MLCEQQCGDGLYNGRPCTYIPAGGTVFVLQTVTILFIFVINCALNAFIYVLTVSVDNILSYAISSQ